MGVLNMRVVETTPGADAESPFSPPADWEGDEEAYRHLMRERYATDLQWGQRIIVQARFARNAPVVFRGPYADVARQIAETIAPS